MSEPISTAAIRETYANIWGRIRDDLDALCDEIDNLRTTLDHDLRYQRKLESEISELRQLADPDLDARWAAVFSKVCQENDDLRTRLAEVERPE